MNREICDIKIQCINAALGHIERLKHEAYPNPVELASQIYDFVTYEKKSTHEILEERINNIFKDGVTSAFLDIDKLKAFEKEVEETYKNTGEDK